MSIGIVENDDGTFTVSVNDRYHIHTTVTSDADEVSLWIDFILHIHNHRLRALLVGLDIEWRPAFGRYTNPVAVLQLCVGRRCLVFQILHAAHVPDSLRRFLSDTRFSFLGVGIGEDVEKLIGDYDLEVRATVDLRTMAADAMGRRELRQAGLKTLANAVMGIDVAKPRHVTLGRWDSTMLSWDQIKYASVDAFLSFEIGRMLRNNEWVG